MNCVLHDMKIMVDSNIPTKFTPRGNLFSSYSVLINSNNGGVLFGLFLHFVLHLHRTPSKKDCETRFVISFPKIEKIK